MADFPPTAGFIDSLDPANPINDNKVFGGDDWFRFVQQVVKNQFPKDEGGTNNGFDIECTAKCSELNTLTGINTGSTLESRISAIESQLNSLESNTDPIARIVAWPVQESLVTQTLTGSNAPGQGTWHLCDGTNLNGSSTYSDLFAKIGNQYGGTDAASMLIPDIQGHVIAGRGTGTVLTGYRQGVNDNTQGNKGGEQSHVQTTGELKNHAHAITGRETSGNNTGDKPAGTTGPDIADRNVSFVGGSEAMNVVQPTIILAFYIRVL